MDIEESMNENSSISVVSPRYWTIFNDDVTAGCLFLCSGYALPSIW
jgi:hypothetical protein